ncbi:hypothetical protein COT42_05885 [Candidatus Saganbacteria bacterium CG08_land_8_20_14_0_20_45_16]|uniref:Response regulatory domain-containing protein n=1 Tax=Candidatus Saganbacteria bacterium CG08_land_8_20_14_0_20_45_16 TaxID=2014293 RepID=A0A2H0XWF7_UNCSA|nr:MAG: hypothetical protein COT42_05885 [Candidatus Saganbacteria bacterium CG08_land_8_20_14_0_20_45_16]
MEFRYLVGPRLHQPSHYLYVRTFETKTSPSQPTWRVKSDYCKKGPVVRRILFVDDYDGLIAQVKLFAKRLWAERGVVIDCVDPTKNIAEQVLKLVRENEYDLIVMDGEMCGDEAAGRHLTKQLRDNEFEGIIVANSTRYNSEILAAGGDFANPGMKADFSYLEEISPKAKSQ